MQARFRGVQCLARFVQRQVSPRCAVRLFSAEAAPSQDVYEHISNMKTKDLFQFEPFNEADLVNFPRESEGKDYSLNWALSSEWFTVWGNAYRNPSVELLESKINGDVDGKKNVSCTRHYLPSSEVPVKAGDFGDIADAVKEYLSQVPNLYVEDGAVCSGRCAEMRIRSVTNDPVTAMALKNMLHRMPKRDPMTPHPLSVIVARGMPESFTAVGMDAHSKALTVVATGDVPLDRVLAEVAKAAAMQMETARGTVEVTVPATEAGKAPTKVAKKGPMNECVVQSGVLESADGCVLVCGLGEAAKQAALQKGSLFCSGNAVLTRDGVSRLFGGECCKDANAAQQAVVVNGEAFARVAKDNLMPFPAKVVLDEAVRSDEEAVKAMTKYCGSEEAAAFAVALLKVSAR
ncbi:hypothetical protein BLSTO_02499 [Blastocystis sp. subtype 1]